MIYGDSSACGLPPNPKAAEAELISKATQTAIIAARSILMSGGTEESALKTAKAAAESVLNPAGSDTETVSGRSSLGSAFGGRRRKAKRQAEVVASMALMSATSLQPNGSSMMGDCDSLNKMYGRNIITVKQDEPSVLSGSIAGSTRPPKPPTPKSLASNSYVSAFSGFRERSSAKRSSKQKETREPSEPSKSRPPLPPTSPIQSPSSMLSSAINNLMAATDDESNLLGVKTLSHSSSMDSERDMSSGESSIGRSGTEDSDEDTSPFFFERKREEKPEKKSRTKKSSSWSFSEVLMNPLTATMNVLHCGGGNLDMPRSESRGDRNTRSRGRRSGRSRKKESPVLDSRDDTFDDDTEFTVGDNKKKGTYRDPDFPNSYSYSSSHSEITDISEQDIQVRSSIRETMESIVSKSKLLGKPNEKKKSSSRKSKEEKQYRSYETSATTPKDSGKKNKKALTSPSMRKSKTRGRSFFKREKVRR